MNSFEEIARKFLEAVTSDLDTHTSIKGEIVKNSSTSFSLLTPDHIQFAAYGRGPSKKMPPLEAMLKMVNEKNILFSGLDKRGTAFAIGMAIKHNGTKNWVPNAPDIMESTVSRYQDIYEKELGTGILVDINNIMKAEFEKIWKEEEKILKDFKI